MTTRRDDDEGSGCVTALFIAILVCFLAWHLARLESRVATLEATEQVE